MKRPLMGAGLMFLLGVAARETAPKSILFTLLILGGGLILIRISNGETAPSKVVNLLLFCLLLFGFLWTHLIEARIRKAEEPLKKAAFSAFSASEGQGKICLEGEVISARNTGFSYQLVVKSGPVRVMVETNAWSGSSGEAVLATGYVQEPETARNPGGYNEKAVLETKGIHFVLRDSVVEETGRRNRWRVFLAGLRERLEKSLYRVFPEREASILSAMLLGERAGMDPETRLLYQKNGMAHILAISGMHIALLAAVLHFLLKLLRVPGRAAAVFVMAALLSYGFLTGMGVPVIRALIMLFMKELAGILNRTEDMATSMVLSLAILAFVMPWALFSAGLLMSFAAVSAVLFGGAVTKKLLGVRRLRGIPAFWRKRLLILLPGSVTAVLLNLFMLPLLLLFYYEFPLYSLLLNILVVPLLSFLVAGGFGAALLGLLPGRIFLLTARGVAVLPRGILRVYRGLCRFALKLPFSLVNPGHARVGTVTVFYAMTALWISWLLLRKRRESFDRKGAVVFLGGALLLLTLLPLWAGWQNRRESRLLFLDVEQGDGSICHASGGPNLIFDCGSGSDAVGKNVLIPALKYYGMSEVDTVFVSHTDRDHTVGLLYLLENAELYGVRVHRTVFAAGTEADDMYLALLEGAKACGAEVLFLAAGDSMDWGSCRVRSLYPFAESAGAVRSGNEYSLVLMLEMAGERVLYTGDIGAETEQLLIDRWGETERLRADILKCPHHGSRFSSSTEFLEAVTPETTIISCGRNNLYGHPALETLERLGAAGGEVHRTDRQGCIMISFSGGEIMVTPFGE